MGLKNTGEIKSEIIAHSRAAHMDIDSAASLNVDRIAIFYGISDIHLKYKTNKTRSEALDIIYDAVKYASSYGIKVRFTAEDASRADINFLRDVIVTARDAGADRISLADTLGILTPESTERLFKSVSDIKNVEYDIHAHNDMGMAVSNSYTAALNGATIIHSTINGLGERVGITPTQVIAAMLKYHMNIDVINLKMLMEISRQVEDYTGISMPPNYPVTGDFAFTHKSGVHVQGIIKNSSTYEFLSPEIFGRTRRFTIDKYSGKHAIKEKLANMGINVGDDDINYILNEIKSTNRPYNDDDLMSMALNKTSFK